MFYRWNCILWQTTWFNHQNQLAEVLLQKVLIKSKIAVNETSHFILRQHLKISSHFSGNVKLSEVSVNSIISKACYSKRKTNKYSVLQIFSCIACRQSLPYFQLHYPDFIFPKFQKYSDIFIKKSEHF